MKKNLLFVLALAAAAFLAGCQKPDPIPEDSISLADETSAILNVTSDEQVTDGIAFTANVAWTAESNSSWATVSPQSGEAGEGEISLAIDANEGDERTAVITVKAGTASITVTVNQEAKPDPFALATDLSANGTANCYQIAEAGTYKIKAVKGNGNEAVAAVSADLIWEYTIFGGDNAIVGPEILVKDGYIMFTTTGTAGNAGIAAKDADGAILWSWHIWAIPENPDITIGGIVAQKHSLGYIAWEANDAYSFGFLYQWGRKDPFPISFADVIKAYAPYAYTNIENHEAGVIGSDGTAIGYSIANPMAYITTDNDTMDWSCVGLDKQDKGLWSATKTVYDPCPVGYRVAGQDFYAAIDASKLVFEITPDATPAHRRIVYDGGVTEFYYSGNLDYNGSWNTWVYSGGWSWSCDVPENSAFAYSAFFLGGYDPAKAWYRGNAHAVRCVKE